MEIIPVIDVARGQAVRASGGNRDSYAPIVTPLAASSDPAVVAKGYARLHPFRKIYIADLDGIEGRGRNVHLVPALSRALPHADIWIDAGTASRGAARAILAAPVTTVVLGSETLETVSVLKDILAEASNRAVLSLDFRGDEFMGPQALLKDASLWPHNVIVMTLGRVGGAEGPDVDRIREIAKRAEGRRVFAAGGIRNRADLDAVRAAGASGALIATALHEQKITAGDLKEIAGR
jgi:HisA/HisF family protein